MKTLGDDFMLKKISIILLISIIISIFTVGCNGSNEDKIAYISADPDSKYGETFEELGLGIIFNFDLKLNKFDKSWVNMWIEGYESGKMVSQSPLIDFSYGFGLKEKERGKTGFGIINPHSDNMQFFMYGLGSSMEPKAIDDNFLNKLPVKSWDYAFDRKIGLESGEELILAVYREVEESLNMYDYGNLDDIKEMIDSDETVLLLKIKIEEKIK